VPVYLVPASGPIRMVALLPAVSLSVTGRQSPVGAYTDDGALISGVAVFCCILLATMDIASDFDELFCLQRRMERC